MSLITYIRWQNDYSAVFFEECSRYQEAQIRWNMHSKGECEDGALEGCFLVISVVDLKRPSPGIGHYQKM